MNVPKSIRLVLGGVLACALLYFFPLFRLRPLTPEPIQEALTAQGSPGNTNSPVDVKTFVTTLWTEQLPNAAKSAASVEDVLAMATTDANGAMRKFGRQVGLGGPSFLFVQGQGRVTSVDEDRCELAIEGQLQHIVLEIGILFGNAVRDSTGLIQVEDFADSQDFNNLSTELNSLCESEVIAPVREQLTVGAIVEFVGSGEVRNASSFAPLTLIPVQLKVSSGAELAK